MDGLLTGLAVVFDPYIMLMVLLGTVGGVIVGILPGIGSTMAIALLLPFTVVMEPIPAIAVLASLFSANAYSGAIPAILVNTPGSGSSTVTCWDGYPLAKRGEAGKALGMATVASGIGGIVSVIVFVIAAPALARLAYEFGPAEYFAMYVFGLSMLASIGASSPVKNLVAGAFGILLATVGIDIMTSVERFTFGYPELTAGIQFVPVLVGLFAISELLEQSERLNQTVEHIKLNVIQLPTREDYRKCWKAIAGSTVIGTFVGILPAAGGTVAALISYNEAKRWSKDPDKFGTGVLEGVAAPEAANNAAAQTSFIPMLSLGLPSNVVMALMIGAMMIQGITPGPNVVVTHPDLFWGLIVSMWIGNIMLVLLNFPLIGMWVRLLSTPSWLLFPAIVTFCCIGVYSLNNSYFAIYILLISGLAGYLLVNLGCELAPFILGFILGPMLEEHLRRAMSLSGGDPMIFVTSPISAVLLIIAALALVVVSLPTISRRRKEVFVEED